MTDIIPIETDRLILRAWRDEDRAPFAALNADPEVMRYFPKLLSREESDALAALVVERMAENGWGWYAVEVKGGEPFAGFVGLNVPGYPIPCGPCVEVGWRLARSAWGKGYASEAARACLGFGFGRLGLDEIVSFTAVGNTRSRAVMERLGMTSDPADDFEHPSLPDGHPLRRHVLYRIGAATWAGLSGR
ncbi:N-acetyltransferase [Thalassobaculum fulvum]|uniref:N-acetyltransferase n=1 Tax=Thalassobaculum fulvum TaxID=1633335 RepID=A0A918XRX2_9PROT|nr:GNAT family N-acetyltransferase [Thalassobaculum fulvum]GHD46936.1 N-acetyltransferase [Thalassobaculum fulvum]